jgi:hypothetical protein
MIMWRLTMVLLGLIAALSGTPLRQAEAASDFARAHAELGQPNTIEMIDGGVGDDSGAAILKAGDDTRPTLAAIQPPTGDASFALVLAASSLPRRAARRWPESSTAIPTRSARRHAWLQCFVF